MAKNSENGNVKVSTQELTNRYHFWSKEHFLHLAIDYKIAKVTK